MTGFIRTADLGCRKANAVEHMIVDALVEADPVFRLADAAEKAETFAQLDDSILRVWAHVKLNAAASAFARGSCVSIPSRLCHPACE